MNNLQEHHLLKIRASGQWNFFDGEKIAKIFEDNQKCWDALVFGNFEENVLSELRELPYSNADTIWVRIEEKSFYDFVELLKDLEADEVSFVLQKNNILYGSGYHTFESKNKLITAYESKALYNANYDIKKAYGGYFNNKILFRLWWD
jgi:hypothetical protein